MASRSAAGSAGRGYGRRKIDARNAAPEVDRNVHGGSAGRSVGSGAWPSQARGHAGELLRLLDGDRVTAQDAAEALEAGGPLPLSAFPAISAAFYHDPSREIEARSNSYTLTVGNPTVADALRRIMLLPGQAPAKLHSLAEARNALTPGSTCERQPATDTPNWFAISTGRLSTSWPIA